MSLPELRRRLVDTVFARFGEDAVWSGLPDPVRVRFRTRDDDARFQDGQYVSRITTIEVRSWEIPKPKQGDVAVLASGSFRVGGQPTLDDRGVWICAVAQHEN